MIGPFSNDLPLRIAEGLLVNFQIAISALVIGLLSGGLLAYLSNFRNPVVKWGIEWSISILRATPVFIAMFFLAGVLRPHYTGLEAYFTDPKIMFVALACLPYITSYAYDQVSEALSQWRRGAHRAAMLLIPNMARSFQVLVSASCFGAAIGVNEAMSVVLSEAELLGDSAWRFVLYALTVLMFFGLMQTVVASSRMLHRFVIARFSDVPQTG
ncbi:hypothetical protein [Roseibium sp.]|uniref:hypothetical protein n=1 Tax=Roseibium sp. TaxID=1936156 RepID=UPI003B52EC11